MVSTCYVSEPDSHLQHGGTFIGSDSDYDDADELEGTATAYASKHIRRKTFTRRPPKASTFRSNDGSSDDGPGQEKENHEVVENDVEDVGWEKMEDIKMDSTGCPPR